MKIRLEDIQESYEKIKSYLNSQNLLHDYLLSQDTDSDVYLKLENLQRTGSFKIRGSLNKVLNMSDEDRKKGVIAGSAGNHAQGVALACMLTNTPCTIVMPTTAPKSKIRATKRYGAEVILEGMNFDDALAKALEIQKETHATFIHAFDDKDIIVGQGTIGLEILEELSDVNQVIVPVGGGGLISGIAVVCKSINPQIRVIGVEVENVPSLSAAVKKNGPVKVDFQKTVADGINVRQVGKLTYDICKELVDEIVTVSEDEVNDAIRYLLGNDHVLAEGAGAVGMAGVISKKVLLPKNSKSVIVVSGGNIDFETLRNILMIEEKPQTK